MTTPREVFDNPDQFWDMMTVKRDDDFEGQHFDRKEAGRVGDNGFVNSSQLDKVRKQITECISAFANTNRDGGLLVLGVSKEGMPKGTRHLKESQVNSLTDFPNMLKNQAATIRSVNCTNSEGLADRVILIYVPYSEHAICETLAVHPEAWVRNEKQNIPMTDEVREQFKRDKRILDFERTRCCPFTMDEVDTEVLAEFRKVYLADAYPCDDVDMLYRAGAIDREDGGFVFNNAGYLFFAANPQRNLPWSYVRLLRFDVGYGDRADRGDSTFDRRFDGSIAQQIRQMQSFFRESGFFKTYLRRSIDGPFVEDPELPYIALDEVITNAVAHRDFAVRIPVECVHYRDAFVVENPGRVLQRSQDLPPEFTLESVRLDSMPRNSKLIEWLKILQFVRAINEGTERMRREMAAVGLPAPAFHNAVSRTTVVLYNNMAEREELHNAQLRVQNATEYVNLFQIELWTQEGRKVSSRAMPYRRKELISLLGEALINSGWYVDRHRYSRIIAHRKGIRINLPQDVLKSVGFYPAYAYQFREYWGKLYLCIDYHLEVKNLRTVASLLEDISAQELRDISASAKLGDWERGRIVSINSEHTRLYLFELGREEQVANNQVIPDLPVKTIERLLSHRSPAFDLFGAIKRHSLVATRGAARDRAERTVDTAEELTKTVFPLPLHDLRATLAPLPKPLHHTASQDLVLKKLPEPSVEFGHQEASTDIRRGITQYGAYQNVPKVVDLVPICIDGQRSQMAALIDRLKVGKYRYQGSERTFGTRFTYSALTPVPSSEDVLGECRRLLTEHPDWVGDKSLNRLFLVHTPEIGYAQDDEKSPYYRVKRLLLEQGVPCQMVDTPTILNPDWKDLNLALNIAAKCGVTPWVLPDSIPDADFFIGLSYTQSRKRSRDRLVGYATVFNQFGRWEFYSGNTEAFSYEDRTRYFASLTEQTMRRLTLRESPSIYFHYSARFSREDREAILRAARSVRDNGVYSFVSINSHHSLRLYDNAPATDGSVSRGSYVVTAPNQILLSTTGFNPFRKSMGTPTPLELTIWTERPVGMPSSEPDLKSLAVQILSLTKLNWASTDSICGEPITTKYAGDIAYLTDAFLRQTGMFKLHPALEHTPWFI